MNRFILVDKNSGYIWADSAQFGVGLGPVELAEAVDRENLEPPRVYKLSDINDTSRSSYLVYEVPSDMPLVTDGQDAEQINAVMSLGRPVARIEWEIL